MIHWIQFHYLILHENKHTQAHWLHSSVVSRVFTQPYILPISHILDWLGCVFCFLSLLVLLCFCFFFPSQIHWDLVCFHLGVFISLPFATFLSLRFSSRLHRLEHSNYMSLAPLSLVTILILRSDNTTSLVSAPPFPYLWNTVFCWND